jgi:hypothetical protein
MGSTVTNGPTFEERDIMKFTLPNAVENAIFLWTHVQTEESKKMAIFLLNLEELVKRHS